MNVFFWFLSTIVALAATGTIAMALPSSAADELSAVTVPQSVLALAANGAGGKSASCGLEGR